MPPGTTASAARIATAIIASLSARPVSAATGEAADFRQAMKMSSETAHGGEGGGEPPGTAETRREEIPGRVTAGAPERRRDQKRR